MPVIAVLASFMVVKMLAGDKVDMGVSFNLSVHDIRVIIQAKKLIIMFFFMFF